LLYGIHLWADLERAARMRLQTKPERLFFVILVTHPKSYTETTDRRDFGGKPSKWRWGRMLSWKIPEFCSVGGARSKHSIFRVFSVPFDYPAHGLQETVFTPNQWYRWKAETLKVCILLVWRVCDQVFGRYRSMNGAKKSWAACVCVCVWGVNVPPHFWDQGGIGGCRVAVQWKWSLLLQQTVFIQYCTSDVHFSLLS